MTGPEHYAAAEHLAEYVENLPIERASEVADNLALAQVHATLALAAATALGTTKRFVGAVGAATEWVEVVAS